MTKLKLSPCHRCEDTEKTSVQQQIMPNDPQVYDDWRLMCMSCGVQTAYFDTEEKAREAWNTGLAE